MARMPKRSRRFRKGGRALAGPDYPEFTSFSYIARFVEVRIEPGIRRVRVPRVVSIADCGRVVSPRTAESQLRGVVWGISAALREETGVDPRYGGWLNNDLADYVVAVNADIGDIDVGFVDRPDPLLNSIGAKGLGEVAMTGVSGGDRQRHLPRHWQTAPQDAVPDRGPDLKADRTRRACYPVACRTRLTPVSGPLLYGQEHLAGPRVD